MTGRPTTDIVAEARAVGAFRHVDEAADRLVELEEDLTDATTIIANMEDYIAKINALLPDCPKCGGTAFVERQINDRQYTALVGGPCPDCLDTPGKASIGWLVAVFNAVFDEYPHPAFVPAPNGVKEAWVAGAQAAFRHLRSVRAEVTEPTEMNRADWQAYDDAQQQRAIPTVRAEVTTNDET